MSSKINLQTAIGSNLNCKVNVDTNYKNNSDNLKDNNKLSKTAQYMIGATILAGTIAVGIIGHKNNWWRKVAGKTEKSLDDSASTQTISRNDGTLPEPNNSNVDDYTTKLISKIKRRFSKETKLAKRSIKQYNELYQRYLDFRKDFDGNYKKYLESINAKFEISDNGIKVYDKNGRLDYIIRNQNESFDKGDYIEYFDKNGKIKKIVSFPKYEPFIFYYDNSGNLTKRITPISYIGSLQSRNIAVAYFNKNKITKETITLQPQIAGHDNNYDTITLYRIFDYKKGKAIEYGSISERPDADKYIRMSGAPGIYTLSDGGKSLIKETGEAIRQHKDCLTYRFNSNNEIVRILKDSEIHFYKTIYPTTGKLSSSLNVDENGLLRDYAEYDQNGEIIRRIMEDFDDQTGFIDVLFENGKANMANAKKIPKEKLNLQELLKRYNLE